MLDRAEPRLIDLPTVPHALGDLTFIDGARTIPFEIRRVFYVCDPPDHAVRGGHAHKTDRQVVVALAGSFEVQLETQTGGVHHFQLDKPTRGLYVPPLHWRTLRRYAPGAVCLVMASEHYDAADYLRDRASFLAWGRGGP